MSRQHIVKLFALFFVFLLFPRLDASVTRHADFPLGEAGSLGTNNRPQDASGNSRHFSADNNGASALVGASGAGAPGSTAYVDTSASTDQWWSGGPNLSGITDNFAIGLYARASSNDTANRGDLLCTSSSGNGAFKISLDGTGWNASAHNIAYIGSRASNFTPDAWVHLALIRSGGQTTFYVNGVAQGASYAAAPVVGSMSLGGFAGSVFDGQMDEARVVTFSSGESAVNILNELQTPAVPPATPPVITSEPQDVSVITGSSVSLAAPAYGAMPMTWRWYHGDTLVSESTTSASLTISNVGSSDAGTYHAEISNTHGSVSSRTLTLTVQPPLATLPPSTSPNASQQAMIQRKYGMFCHFGINTFHNEQWTDGTKSPSTYTPTAVDVDQWVRTAYLSGMTYILIIAKHHDGFCMWPSAYTTYDVASSPNSTDVMRLASEACKKYGIKLAVYYSLWDRNWNNGAMRGTSGDLSPEQSAAYVSYMKNQLTELLGNYGPVCELWLDGGWVLPDDDWNIPVLYDHVKQLQPECQFSSNLTIGNPAILPANQQPGNAMRYFPCDFRLYDPYLPKFPDPKTFSHGGNTYYLPFEATITLSSQNFWFYDTREVATKSLGQLENWWNAATAQNNLLVFNAAPDRNGVLLPWDVTTLARLASRLGLEPGGVFPENLAKTAVASASSVYGDDTANYGPSLATDDNPDSRWSAAAGSTSGWLELDFGVPTKARRVIINEYLSRVQSYNLQAWDGSSWSTIHSGTTLGESTRIDFPEVTTTKLRLNLLSASDVPSIWMFKVQSGEAAVPPPDHDGVWVNPGGGVWQVPELWENSAIASGADRVARFDTLDLTSNATIYLQGPLSIGQLRFGDTTPTHDWSVDPVNDQILTLATATGTPLIDVNNRRATLATRLEGSVGFTKSGTGVLALNAVNGCSGGISVGEGSLLVNGSIPAASAVTVGSGATLGGSGVIHGSVAWTPGAFLSPGDNGRGTITFSSALALPAGVSTRMEIHKSGTARTSDRILGSAGIAYGGTLIVNASGDVLSSGDRFQLFQYGSGGFSGSFVNMELPPLAPGLKWDLSGLNTTGEIVVADTGVAKPAFSKPAGCYYGAQTISLACSTPGAVIHFTTDGTMPSPSSPVYSSAISIPENSTVVIHAIARVPGMDDSLLASATYTTTTNNLTIQAWYHLGETTTLGTNNRPQDGSGNARHFTNNQNTTSVSVENAGGPLGRSSFTSTESLLCGSGQINGFWNNGYALPADNAGMEIWVKASPGYTDGWIFASGSGNTHLVLAVSGGKYRASTTGGTSWFDDAATAVSTTAWTHLALVRSGGTTVFYVNGVEHGSSSAVVSAGNTTHLAVTSGGNSGFKGWLDEARMFTFESGAFQTSDLLYRANNAPVFPTNPLVLTATQGSPFSGMVAASDPDDVNSLLYGKISGPAWLSVSQGGNLSGTPGAEHSGGNFFVIRATDAFGAAATLMLSIHVSISDENANDIADDWENAMFGSAGAGANLPLDDADGDGMCNLLEYGFNTHPLQPGSSPVVQDIVTISGQKYLRLIIPKNPGATNLLWSVEMSDSMASGSWTTVPVVVDPPETPTLLQVRCADPVATAPRKFARVRVVSAE